MTAVTDSTYRPPRRALLGFALALLAAGLLSAALAGDARAAFGFEVDGESIANEAGDPAVQAGSHPWHSNVTIAFNRYLDEGMEIPEGQFKNIETILPPGQVGSALATPVCERPDFSDPAAYRPLDCPNNTAIGWAKVKPNWVPYYLYGPVYNLEPEFGEPALFGFRIATATIYLHAKVRSGKNAGVTLESRESSQGLPITDTQVTLWGVPADPSHDLKRGRCLQTFGETGESCSSDIAPKPLINYPTACSGPLKTTLRSDSWAEPGVYVEDSFLSHGADGVPAGVEGCEKLGFEPRMTFAMQPSTAASPGSLDVTMTVPQNQSPDGLVSAHLKKVVATLPEGVTLNSASADGLSSCTLEQIGLEEGTPSQCPVGSRIGTVRVKTPLLADELGGSLFLAKQKENPFGSLIALYLAIEDKKNGVYLKTPGQVILDPQTGRLTTIFDEQPQLPFNELELSFAGGPRAALATPSACGTYEASYSLSSWSGKTVNGSSAVKIDQNCGKEQLFSPGFEAGTVNPVGGEYSPFTMRVTREDGQQNLAAIDVALPPGLSAKLAGVALCGEAAAASGDCPAASRIGTTTVASGVGSNPVYVPQAGKAPSAIYLAGPYKDGPYSLVVKVPAQAGPFDLGTVAVRSAIYVDRTTAQVSVKSDQLPQMLQGVPIAYRDVRVDVNRPQFTINPTSCDPMSVKGAIGSAAGRVANVSSRFQAGDCGSLGFAPRLRLSLKGGTKRAQHPALKAVLTQPPGSQANIARVSVTLPRAQFIDQGRIGNVCTRPQFDAGSCPANSVLGTATASTPLLDRPLSGKVYLRANGGERVLPDLVADLKGAIGIVLVGHIDAVTRKGTEISRIRTTFPLVPDAPVSKFVMQLNSGSKSLLVNSTNLCKASQRAVVKMDGQNGRVRDFNPVMKNDCSAKAKRKRGG